MEGIYKFSAGVRPLSFFKIVNLERPNFRVINIHMFNPFVTDLALAKFLSQFGEVVSAARYVNDPMGFWTGRRQFQVLLHHDSRIPGGLKRPPAIFNVGGERGYLFYARHASLHFEGGASNLDIQRLGVPLPAVFAVARVTTVLLNVLHSRLAMDVAARNICT